MGTVCIVDLFPYLFTVLPASPIQWISLTNQKQTGLPFSIPNINCFLSFSRHSMVNPTLPTSSVSFAIEVLTFTSDQPSMLAFSAHLMNSQRRAFRLSPLLPITLRRICPRTSAKLPHYLPSDPSSRLSFAVMPTKTRQLVC